MKKNVQELFQRYQEFFRKGLKGEVDLEQVASSYATAFIAASPAGVMVGHNDDQLKQVMQQGFEAYRRMGTKDMRIRSIDVTPMDEHHCLVRVGWTGIYDRGNDPDVSIDFDVHYFVQELQETPKVFGWVSGDEQAVLKQHGII